MVLEASDKGLERLERVASAHLCKPTKEVVIVCVCI